MKKIVTGPALKNFPFIALPLLSAALFSITACNMSDSASAASLQTKDGKSLSPDTLDKTAAASSVLDTALYNQKVLHIVNGDSSGLWPVKSAYPNAGALLPFNRIISFYGNLYSKQMGILGELPPQQMLDKLKGEVKKWKDADTSLGVIPAL